MQDEEGWTDRERQLASRVAQLEKALRAAGVDVPAREHDWWLEMAEAIAFCVPNKVLAEKWGVSVNTVVIRKRRWCQMADFNTLIEVEFLAESHRVRHQKQYSSLSDEQKLAEVKNRMLSRPDLVRRGLGKIEDIERVIEKKVLRVAWTRLWRKSRRAV